MVNKGLFSVNKPIGYSSYDMIRIIKKIFPHEKIGHGGTLDPQAEGVLVIGVGRDATKKLHAVLHEAKKEYEAEIMLGYHSETDDSEGPIKKYSKREPEKKEIETILKYFIGEIMQKPPRFSAVKIKGTPAYKIARKGQKVDIKEKKVYVHNIKLTSYDYPIIKLRVTCSSGVYIRSLARDIGKKLETGAYVTKLKRTKVGEFDINKSISVDEIS